MALSGPATCTSIGAGEPKFRIWLTISAGRKEKVEPGKLCGSTSAQLLDIIGGGGMIFVQRDQDIAVLRAHAAGIEIGAVGAADRQADIVDDRAQLVGRDDLADAALDMVEQGRGFFDAGADRRADMQEISPASTAGKKFSAQERHQQQRQTARKPESPRRTCRAVPSPE